MNKDTVVGIVGALVLVSAMVGVFFYERNAALAAGIGHDPAGPAQLANFTIPTLRSSVALGETEPAYVDLTNATGVTNVTFTLAWSATNGRDTMRLTVAPPAGSGITEGAIGGPEDDEEISVTIQVPPGASAAGLWEVKVEFVSASPDPLPGGVAPPTPPPNSTDTNVDYSVAVTVS